MVHFLLGRGGWALKEAELQVCRYKERKLLQELNWRVINSDGRDKVTDR